VSDLLTETVYYFEVAATNALGTSSYSPAANLTTAPGREGNEGKRETIKMRGSV
jgi:hypothetical protein